jgi:hypothetical protein
VAADDEGERGGARGGALPEDREPLGEVKLNMPGGAALKFPYHASSTAASLTAEAEAFARRHGIPADMVLARTHPALGFSAPAPSLRWLLMRAPSHSYGRSVPPDTSPCGHCAAKDRQENPQKAVNSTGRTGEGGVSEPIVQEPVY